VVTNALSAAYAHCQQLARAHYENFPVASRLLPAAMRPHIAAIYAFARRADDFADEPGLRDDERLRLLDDWLTRLDRATAQKPAAIGSANSDDLIFVALSETIRVHRLPVTLFEDLLSAFRQDVTTRRYASWTEVLDYCRRSANPVGRLVLRVAGYDDPSLDLRSDAVCTALQLTNFWQDLARDWTTGRLYVPLEDRDRTGARDEDLQSGRISPAWRAALAEMVRRTRALYATGQPICDAVRGRLKWELRFTWLGGWRILDKLERVDFDVFRRRPTLAALDVPVLALQAFTWRTPRTGA
jgi:hydroxysqualene synthase